MPLVLPQAPASGTPPSGVPGEVGGTATEHGLAESGTRGCPVTSLSVGGAKKRGWPLRSWCETSSSSIGCGWPNCLTVSLSDPCTLSAMHERV